MNFQKTGQTPLTKRLQQQARRDLAVDNAISRRVQRRDGLECHCQYPQRRKRHRFGLVGFILCCWRNENVREFRGSETQLKNTKEKPFDWLEPKGDIKIFF
jgi:hypothetical protein